MRTPIGNLIPDGPPVCWKCMKVEVRRPLEMCGKCAHADDAKSSKRGRSVRTTETQDRTRRAYEAGGFTPSDLDESSYKRWLDLTDN